ncbi:nascent polypeptide-associated complex subunit beta [Mortierella sp. GBAus27b]|nr:Nascent polypeptide-associated complex subunit beta [Mortierella sp. GBA43]KAI8359749.1 nascent polypeptide-associated complex subunit beta [Mortierella sp. GBAus27b]
MNPEKLAKLQANANRSKGTPRRVIKKVHRPVAQDDRKLQTAIEKLALTPQPHVEEVNMFLEEGSILNFRQPKVHSSTAANTSVIYGRAEAKTMAELIPDLLKQLGPDSMANLRRLAESYQKSAAAGADSAAGAQDDDDEVPDLVESFEDVSVEAKETA